MAGIIGELELMLTASDAGLTAGLKTAEQSITNFAKTIATGEMSLQKIGGATALVGASLVGLAAVIGGSTLKAAADFQKLMVTTGNNAGMTAQEITQMSKAVLALSGATGASKDDLANAYMYIHDMGFAGKDAQDILLAATKEGLATGANIADTASVLATAMHSFNIPAQDAANALDQLHTAAASARMTMQDFMTSFGPVGAQAAAIGVPMTDAAAAMAALTRNGFDAATSGTQVRDMLLHMMAPTKAAQKEIEALSKKTGVDLVGDFSQAGLKAKGLTGVLNDLKTATGGNAQEMNKLIPNLRGGLGATVLTGKGNNDMMGILGKEQGSKGSTDKAYQEYAKTAAAQTAKLKENLSNLSITVGNGLVPVLNTVLDKITPLITKFVEWSSKHPQLLSNIILVVGAIGGLLIVVGLITASITTLMPIIAGVGAVLAVLLSPIGLVTLGIVALVAGIVLLGVYVYQNFNQIKATIGSAMATVGKNIQSVLGDIMGAWKSFTGFIGNQIDGIIGHLQNLAGKAKDLLSYLNPFARHSPSLVEQVTSGVSVIKQHYMSLGQMQMPQLSASPVLSGGAGGGGLQSSTINNNSTNMQMNNVFNVQGEANASNAAAYIAFMLEQKGIV